MCENETRGAVFKKQQFITVCYSTCVRIEMKQEGQFSKKNMPNLLQYETRGAVFKKQQFITVCYSTCVRIEMKQEGQFSKKKNNLLQYAIQQEGQFSKNNNLLLYAIQLVCVLKWNKRDSFQKKTKFITVCYSTCVHIEMKQEGQFSKKSN